MMSWDQIRREYESTDITLKALAGKYDIKLGTLKSRKSREKWVKDDGATEKDATQHKKVAKKKGCNPTSKIESNDIVEALVESEELTEKQRLFCLYYVKTFNATQSMIKAGYAPGSAHVEGHRLLRNHKVAEYIKKLKSDLTSDLFIEAMDVLRKYVEIAFADITDYVSFGKREVKQTIDDKTESIEVTFVDIKPSDEVDGTIIQEVKQSREGLSIKLHDKMKALEKLEQYFDLLPDHHKRKLEEEKSILDKQKYELDKRLVELREREEKMKAW